MIEALPKKRKDTVGECNFQRFEPYRPDWIAQAFPACRGLQQVGRKQVWQFYAAHNHLSEKTLAEYGYAFRLLWDLLGRTGEPPWPKATAESVMDDAET